MKKAVLKVLQKARKNLKKRRETILINIQSNARGFNIVGTK